MAMWTCHLANCSKACVSPIWQCIICDRHLCAKHLGSVYLSSARREVRICPHYTPHQLAIKQEEQLYDPISQEAEQKGITKLLTKNIIPALLSRASHMRNGVPCSLPQSLQYDHAKHTLIMGGMNCRTQIQFED
jgi:hypothetical protein